MYFRLQRYYIISKYAIFLQKICFFSRKICTIQKIAVPLQPISLGTQLCDQRSSSLKIVNTKKP